MIPEQSVSELVPTGTRREFVSVAVGQTAVLFATAAVAKILTSELGGVEYGRLALGLTLTAFLAQSLYGPLSSALARLWQPYRETGRSRTLIAAADLVLSYITASLGLIGLVVALALYGAGKGDVALFLGGSVGFALLQNVLAVYNALETANRRRVWAAVFQSLVPVSRLGFGAGAVLLFGGSSTVAAFGLALGVFVVLVVQRRVFNSSLDSTREPSNPGSTEAALRDLWSYGRYFLAWGALTGLQVTSDVWALRLFTTEETVGIYALSSLIAASTIAAVGAVVTQYVYPIAFQRAGSGSSVKRVRSAVGIVRDAALVMCGLTLLAVATTTLVGPEIVLIFSAPSFVAAGSLLPPIILAAGLQQVANLLGLVSMILADMRPYLILRVTTTLLAIVLNVLGAWRFGLDGLIGSLLVSSLVYVLGATWLQARAAQFDPTAQARRGIGTSA